MGLEEFEKKIGYQFKDRTFLTTALTHSSFANEYKTQSYEKIEFLGDSILGFICSKYLFEHFPTLSEGELTKRRAILVCEKSLCGFSQQLEVNKFMRLSHGEERSGGRKRISILADMFESITAAIYLDSENIEVVKKFVLKFIEPASKTLGKTKLRDFKTYLQEIIQQNPEEKLSYVVVTESGPDHNKHFKVEVRLNSNCIGKGGGKSKKEAEQEAARVALELMGY